MPDNEAEIIEACAETLFDHVHEGHLAWGAMDAEVKDDYRTQVRVVLAASPIERLQDSDRGWNWPGGRPACPKCGSKSGVLGTENAYFICESCGTERYWLGDHRHPFKQGLTWNEAVLSSPYARRDSVVRIYTAEVERLQARVAELEGALEEIRDLYGYYSRSIPEDIAERALNGGVAS